MISHCYPARLIKLPLAGILARLRGVPKPACNLIQLGVDGLALRFLFGCWHRRLSRPFTISGKTYEVSVRRGKKFPYSLDTMSLVKTNH